MIPGGHRHGDLPVFAQLQSQDSDQGKQGQQDGGGTGDGLVRPLALGLDVQMGSDFLTRHLH